jgi:hypothetical protein
MAERASQEHVLRVTDFSETPGARYRSDGSFSGEEFREALLQPAFAGAIKAGAVLTVDLDGTYGYATSFLEEAFGGLAAQYGSALLLKHLRLKTDDEPTLRGDVERYIREGNKRTIGATS